MTAQKRIVSVVIAIAVSMGLIMLFEYLGSFIIKTSTSQNAAMSHEDLIKSITVADLMWVLLGYVVSSFIGGLVASIISGRAHARPAIIVGAILTVGGIMNLIALPIHPLWFIIANSFAFIPFAWFGYLVVRRREETKEETHIPSPPSK